MSKKAAVLLPLYIYPFPGAWEPLYESVTKYPHLDFIVIINPHNGPGEPEFPDEEYEREIPRLNSFSNVRTIGYIRADYCRRDIAEAYADVAKYAGWHEKRSSDGLGVHGIFVDETPNLHFEEHIEYLDALSKYIKNTSGILGDRLVIHNPGTVPDVGYAAPGPDVTTVVEESFTSWSSVALKERLSSLLQYDRSRCAYMVHSVPHSEIRALVGDLREHGKYLFVTDLTEHYYVNFGSSWQAFVEAIQLKEDISPAERT